MNKHFLKLFLFCLFVVILDIAAAGDGDADIHATAAAIRYEATLPNNSEVGRPLPLAAHWNTGEYPGGFDPDYQLKMIAQGHYLLPWFYLPPPTKTALNYGYYRKAIKKLAELNLPISFISTQWERVLTDAPNYFSRKKSENPNVVNERGKIVKKVSPFGPVDVWHTAGKSWTARDIVYCLQTWYPQPPLVLFISNNEHKKLRWNEVEKSSRYIALKLKPADDQRKRQMVGDAWIPRYRALQQGIRDGLLSEAWKNAAKFVGYGAFGSRAFGRWDEWINYSLYVPGRMAPWPLAWDGASVSYYVDNWNKGTDFTVRSPQVEAMNWVFMQTEAYRDNPEFWFEMSTWDGQAPSYDNDKKKYYIKLGQNYGPDRYEGFVQFGMWLLQPRVVREFRGLLAKVEYYEPYFLKVVNAVDRVHNNAILQRFWRRGKLVANIETRHPYQRKVPEEYKTVNRWFMLKTNVDPKARWNQFTKMPVFSMARVIGKSPRREWLVYVHSPLSRLENVKIKIPGYDQIKVKTSPAGDFFHVIESSGAVNRI